MVDLDEFDLERAQFDQIARLDHVHLHALDVAVLLEFLRHQRQRQARAVHGRREFFEHVGRGADVIFVAVGDDVTADALPVFFKIGKVGDHQIDARHVVAGKHGADVHHHDVVAVFEYGHVHADLAQSPEGDDAQPGFFFLCGFCVLLSQKYPSFAVEYSIIWNRYAHTPPTTRAARKKRLALITKSADRCRRIQWQTSSSTISIPQNPCQIALVRTI